MINAEYLLEAKPPDAEGKRGLEAEPPALGNFYHFSVKIKHLRYSILGLLKHTLMIAKKNN